MEANSSMNNFNAKATISFFVGPNQFFQKSIHALFLSYFQVVIEIVASLSEKLKGRPIIIVVTIGLIKRLL